MPEKKKREKVVAEITVAHLTLLVREMGSSLSLEEAVAFLNQGDCAYGMWKEMMHAGEQYIKSTLKPAGVKASCLQGDHNRRAPLPQQLHPQSLPKRGSDRLGYSHSNQDCSSVLSPAIEGQLPRECAY